MGRTKGSKNKPKEEKESLKLQEKQLRKSERHAEAAFDDLVDRATQKGALVEVTDYRNT